jgi:HPt (histidine-containing phosphotransfer) domain-containing protein
MNDESLLDMELLGENAANGLEDLRELIDMYLAQADETMTSLRTAVQAGAAADINQLAHRLAGSSAVCGVTGMVGPLRTLEQRAREGRLSDPDSLLATLAERLESCRRLLAEYLRR